MQDIRAFGRIPKEVRGSSEAQLQERRLAERLRRAKQAGLLSAAQKSELAVLRYYSITSSRRSPSHPPTCTLQGSVKTHGQSQVSNEALSLLMSANITCYMQTKYRYVLLDTINSNSL